MLALEWSRVDLGANLLYLGAEHQKNGKVGIVPLNREARAAIASRAQSRAKHGPEARRGVLYEQRGQDRQCEERIRSGRPAGRPGRRASSRSAAHVRELAGPGRGGHPARVGADAAFAHPGHRERVRAAHAGDLAPGDPADAVEVFDRTPTGDTVSRLGFTLPESGEEGGSDPAITD